MRIIPTRIHGILDYLVSVILIVTPWLLGFNGPNTATYILVALGIVAIMYSLITNYEWGAVRVLSMPMHLMLDLVSGFLLAISPWLFGFSKYIYLPHLLLGILEILVSLMTDPIPYGIRKDLEARRKSHSADNPIKGRSIFLILVAALAIQCSEMKEYDEPASKLDAKDLQFIVDAGYSNLNETNAGTVAARQAAREEVRMFGQMMVEDHTTAQTELKTIADAAKAPVPDQPDSVHRLMVQSMSNLSGNAFDSTYLKSQVADHQTAVDLFRSELNSGKDSSVKRYARKYLPKIQMHLTMADSLLRALQHP